MKKLNIVTQSSGQTNIDGFENIDANALVDIFPCSVQVIYCDIYSSVANNDAYKFLDQMIDKIIPNGQLILKIYDIKRICELYLNNNINEESFFDIVRTIGNPINQSNIKQYCNASQKLSVSDIKRHDIFSTITLTKHSV